MSYREAILEAAKSLFAERGYSEASISDLAHETGAAEGTIFHHFKNKEELYVSVLERTRDDLTHELTRALDAEPSKTGLAEVENIIMTLFRLADEMPVDFILLSQSYAHQLATVNPTAREHLESLYQALLGSIAGGIERGAADGSIAPGQTDSRALVILTMVTGLIRMRSMGLWPSTRTVLEARDFCHNALRGGRT